MCVCVFFALVLWNRCKWPLQYPVIRRSAGTSLFCKQAERERLIKSNQERSIGSIRRPRAVCAQTQMLIEHQGTLPGPSNMKESFIIAKKIVWIRDLGNQICCISRNFPVVIIEELQIVQTPQNRYSSTED